MRGMRSLADAHLPTWLKIQLRDASSRRQGLTYAGVGYHLAYYHSDQFDLEEKGALDVSDEEIANSPTKTLRRLFRNEEHPRADFADYIPPKRRRDFLRGLVAGVAQDDPPGSQR